MFGKACGLSGEFNLNDTRRVAVIPTIKNYMSFMHSVRQPFESRLKRKLLPFLLLFLPLLFWTQPLYGQSGDVGMLYYYFPDSPQGNIPRLKSEMETFFAKAGFPITFQAFTHLADLEMQLQREPPDFLLIPEAYIVSFGQQLPIKPLLIPRREGSSSYKKVLLQSGKNNFATSDLKGRSLAMTQTVPDKTSLLAKLSTGGRDFDYRQVSVITIPKDADAIFALALGQVDLALVSTINLELVCQLSPQLRSGLKIIEGSVEISMPVLCSVEKRVTAAQIARLQKILLSEMSTPKEKIILGMLHIDGWKEFTN